MRPFRDRQSAGEELGALLVRTGRYGGDSVVLGLPRGGVPVAAAVAEALDAELDIIVVRKLGTPRNPELAMGAIGSGGGLVLDDGLIASLGVTPEQVQDTVVRERAELERREDLYRSGRPTVELEGRTVILVDDGIATGSSMQVAVEMVARRDPASITVAVPVAPTASLDQFTADHVVAVATPEPFFAVGAWYVDFGQTSDGEVRAILADA